MSAALALEPARLAALSTRFEEASTQDVLRWAVESFAPGRLALVSAFGPTSSVILHLLQDIAPDLPVVFVDTLHHFPETLQHVEAMRRRFGLNLQVYRPAATRADFEARYGPRLWERDLDLYQQVSKVEPFRRATEGLDAWLTGRRREQSETRCELPVVETGVRIKVNPLAGWSRKQVWHHILEHQLPYNPLHDLGYASIGDEPLTTPVHDGEHERAGRWRGTGKLECGIHLLDHTPEQAAAD
ncbi:MAG TPA: phosphoadenylyl-sulfate reductase [Longimicrobium sp.]|nr:phosphoadenylyl-sulfate reductase [Longimicrobium sp.]